MNKFKRIYVEITNRCNLNCSFCSKEDRVTREMSLEEFSHVIKSIRPFTDYIYLHVKGEPLLHSNFSGILNIAKENQMKVNITTNGVLLDKYTDVLLNSGCVRQINVSLHSENDIPNYFDKVFAACKKLSKNIYISYRLWALTDKKLDQKSTAIVEKIISSYKLSPEVVEKLYNDDNIKIDINTFVNKDNLFIWPSLNSEIDTDGYCLGTISHLGILVDGSVIPCCLSSSGDVKFGNVFTEDFSTIINSPFFKTVQTGFKNNKAVCELCRKCTYKNKFKI